MSILQSFGDYDPTEAAEERCGFCGHDEAHCRCDLAYLDYGPDEPDYDLNEERRAAK